MEVQAAAISLQGNNFVVVQCNKVGTFSGFSSVIIGQGTFANMTDGITIGGVQCNVVDLRDTLFRSTSATFVGIDFGSTLVQTVNLSSWVPVAPTTGAIGLKGLASSGNMVAGFVAGWRIVFSCLFPFRAIPPSGPCLESVAWNIRFR